MSEPPSNNLYQTKKHADALSMKARLGLQANACCHTYYSPSTLTCFAHSWSDLTRILHLEDQTWVKVAAVMTAMEHAAKTAAALSYEPKQCSTTCSAF